MSTLNDTDLFVIERSGTNYQVRSNEMSTLQDTDLFVVERSGTNYQVEAKDINLGPTGSIDQPVSVLTPLNGAGTNEGEPYQPLSTAITAVGAGGSVVYSTDTIANVVSESQWNQSRTWSNEITSPDGTISSTYSASNAFSGNLTTRCQTTDVGKTIRWTPAGGIVLTSSFRVYTGAFSGEISARVSGVDYVLNANANNVPASGYVDSTVTTGNLEYIDVQGQIGAGTGYVTGYAVNGKLLVNDGIPNPPMDEILTFPTDNNFDKFEVGEVVQSTSFEEAFGVSAGDPFYWGKNGTVFDRYVDIPVIPGTSYFAGVTSPGGEDGRTEIYDENNTMYNAFNNGDGYLGASVSVSKEDSTKFIIPAGFVGNVTRLYMVNSAGSVARGTVVFSYDGVTEYTSTDGAVNTSITAIDDTVPSITVDGGSWYGADGTGDAGDGRFEPAQEWSNLLTSTTGFNPNKPAVNAFDGSVGAGSTRAEPANSVGLLEITLSGLTPNDAVEVYTFEYNGGGGGNDPSNDVYVEINGTKFISPSNPGGNEIRTGSVDGNGNVNIKLNSIAGNASPGWNYALLQGIKIAGKLLVDLSIPGGPGATDISKTVTSDASLTFNSDLELANMVGPLSQVDENGDVKTPVTSEIASVDSNLVVWSNYLTANLSLQDPTNAFNGDTSDGALDFDGAFNTTKTYRLTFTPPTPIAFSSTVELFSPGGPQAPYYNTWRVDLGSGFNTQQPVVQNSWVTVASGGGTLVSLITEASQNGTAINAIRVDGVILQDTVPFGTVLTFNTPNPDLQYFQPGDDVGTSSGFAPVAYTGNSGTQSITGVGFSPDLVWIKVRSTAGSNPVSDTVRGFGASGSSKIIYTDATNAQDTGDTQILKSFDNDGFTVGTNALVNQSGQTYIAWCWDASGTTVTNNDGTIESQVRSNGNFSVISYTGGGDSVGHGLSNAPSFVIAKSLASGSWLVGHASAGWSLGGNLNNANSFGASSYWSSTSPDSSVIYLGGDTTSPSVDYVAYAWAETPGVSSFGEYTGNNGTQSIDCGFEPAFVMIKKTSAQADWIVFDNKIGDDTYLKPSTSDAEATNGSFTLLPNGFSLDNGGGDWNGAGATYIYAAFAGSNPIEVIDVDVAANTMTVDGGDWGAYDQSEVWSTTRWTNTGTGYLAGRGLEKVFGGGTGTAVAQPGTAEFEFALNGDFVGEMSVKCGGERPLYLDAVEIYDGSDGGTSTQTFNVTAANQKIIWKPNPLDSINGATGGAIFYNGKQLLDTGVTGPGETVVTGPPLIASADDVEYLDGNTLGVNGITGTWLAGLHAQGAEVTAHAPSPESIVFTSMNAGTTEFTGTDASLTSRTWTLEKANSATGPWSQVGEYVDTAANASQDGATPWDNPALEANTFYQVKVEYSSNNAASVVSTFNTFKTGDA